jgi:hypothetical protein
VEGLDNRWAAASVGSFTASSLELQTGASIMAIGGFTGGDDYPTLAQFQAYVAQPGDRKATTHKNRTGALRYFIRCESLDLAETLLEDHRIYRFS